MQRHTGCTPTVSAHVRTAEFCAVPYARHRRTDRRRPVDRPYLARTESRSRVAQLPIMRMETSGMPCARPARTAPTCQLCDAEDKPIETRIAHNPGADETSRSFLPDPPSANIDSWVPTPYSRLMSSVTQARMRMSWAFRPERCMRAWRISVATSTSAGRVSIDTPAWAANRLTIPITVENETGHKLPTAYPSRRVWLQVVVKDATGSVVFTSWHRERRRLPRGRSRPRSAGLRGGRRSSRGITDRSTRPAKCRSMNR